MQLLKFCIYFLYLKLHYLIKDCKIYFYILKNFKKIPDLLIPNKLFSSSNAIK